MAVAAMAEDTMAVAGAMVAVTMAATGAMAAEAIMAGAILEAGMEAIMAMA